MSGILYTASKTICAFMASDDFVRLLVGPVGSGKTTGCEVEVVRRAIETPPCPDGVRRSRWGVIRNTYPELRDTTMKTWDEWVPSPHFGRWRVSEHTFDLHFETDAGTVRAEVMFRALDRPEDVAKLLSMELTGCFFNEWREIPRPVTDLMQTRVGRYPRKADVPRYWTGIFGDTNPPDTDHYLYRVFEEERPPGHRVFRQPGGASPEAENLDNLDSCWDPTPDDLTWPAHALGLPVSDPRVRAEHRLAQRWMIALGHHEEPCRCYYVKLAHGKNRDFVRVYRDGEYGYVQEGKPVWPEFVDSVHVPQEEIPVRAGKVIIGNDYGLTPAAVWVQRDPRDGQYQVVREFVSDRMGATGFGAEQARICKTEFRDSTFEGWGDPAGLAGSSIDERETPIDVVAAQGVPMSAAPTNDFTVRRDAVGNLLGRLTRLGRPALSISPRCRVLRKGMAGGYCFRRLQVRGDDRFRDAPDKENVYSHVCDALQYALVGAGEDPRRPVPPGEPDGQEEGYRVRVRVVGRGGYLETGYEPPTRVPRVIGRR